MRREWIVRCENNEKIRLIQSILNGLVKAGIEKCVGSFDLSDMRDEIVRVGRLEKVRTMRLE